MLAGRTPAVAAIPANAQEIMTATPEALERLGPYHAKDKEQRVSAG
jgi:hypothetical protein